MAPADTAWMQGSSGRRRPKLLARCERSYINKGVREHTFHISWLTGEISNLACEILEQRRSIMHTRTSILAAILLVTAGCAAGPQGETDTMAFSQQQTAQQRMEYRTQATSLREMAD